MNNRRNPQNILRAVLGILLLLLFKTEAFSLVGTTSTRTTIRNRQSTRGPPQQTILASPTPSQHSSLLILNGFLDGIFGNSNDNNSDLENGVLSVISVGEFDEATLQVRYDSLSDYITDKWMDLFETKSIGLTTPVKVFKRYDGGRSDDTHDDDATISERACCRLVFQKVDNGYNDKDDEDDETDDGTTPQQSKEDEPKQGGVEMEVQTLTPSNTLRVVARRCEIDEDTMIKEMSEELILKELQKAINVWKKETL